MNLLLRFIFQDTPQPNTAVSVTMMWHGLGTVGSAMSAVGRKTRKTMNVLLRSTVQTICNAIDRVYATPNPQIGSFFHNLRVEPQASDVPAAIEELAQGEMAGEALFLYAPSPSFSAAAPTAEPADHRIVVKR
jgi:hypothetical protein